LYFDPNCTTSASPGIPRRALHRADDPAESGRIADVESGRAEIHMIEEIEELGPKLNRVRLEEPEVLHR
jgi:hypothetical protein